MNPLSKNLRGLWAVALLLVGTGLAPAQAQQEGEEEPLPPVQQQQDNRRSEGTIRGNLKADQLVPFQVGGVNRQSFEYEMVPMGEGGDQGPEELGTMELTVGMESTLYQDEKVVVEQQFDDYELIQRIACYLDPITLSPARTEAEYTYGDASYNLSGDYYFDQIIISNDGESSSYTKRVRNVEESLDHASLPFLVTRIDFSQMGERKYAVVNLIHKEEAFFAEFTVEDSTIGFDGEDREVHLLRVDYGQFEESYWIGKGEGARLYRYDTGAYGSGNARVSFRLTEVGEEQQESEYVR